MDLKEAGVLCGAMAATTERIGIATGLVIDALRHPLMGAAFGATMQQTFGDRFTYGITRGVRSWLGGVGVAAHSPDQLEAYVVAMRSLWAGDAVKVEHEGKTARLEFVDKLAAPPPKVVWGTFGNARAVEIAGRTFDGIALIPFFTPEAVADTVTQMRESAARNGRDPRELRIIHCMVVAPDVEDEDERLAIVNGRAVTYFQMPGYGDRIIAKNGWDPEHLETAFSAAGLDRSRGGVADLQYHRHQLVEIGRRLPEHWIAAGAAVGTARQCADKMADFFSAGVDEIWIHGSSPAQCEGLVALWREEYSDVVARGVDAHR